LLPTVTNVANLLMSDDSYIHVQYADVGPFRFWLSALFIHKRWVFCV